MAVLADLTPLRRSAAFRRLWWGLGVSQLGHQLTVIAVGLEAYHLTNSTLAVGIIGLCELLPLVIFGLYGGALVDQVDRRRAALVATAVLWLTTLGLVVQAVAGARSTAVLYALVAFQAAGFAVNSAARSAIVPRLLDPSLMPAANALQGIAGNLAMTLGPVLGAVLVASVGFTAAYATDAILMTFAWWALLRLPPILPEGHSPGTGRRVGLSNVLEGLRYLTTQPNVRMTFLVDLCAMILAMPRVIFPAVGVLYLGGAATTTGLLTTAIAVGGITASVFSGALTRIRWQGRIIAWAVAGWAVSIIGFGVVLVNAGATSPDHVLWVGLALALLTLAAAGASDAISAVFRQTILQTATPDHLRGRLQGVFIIVVAGGPRLADVLLGAGSEWVGEAWVTVLGGIACLVVLALLLRTNRGFLGYDARHPQP